MTLLSYSPFSVFLELFVEIGYQIAFIVMIDMVYRNVSSIGGWSRYEMMFFVGLNLSVSELLRSMVFIGSAYRFPELIRHGNLDQILAKPVDSMFMATLANPYISGLASVLPGLYLMQRAYSLGNLNILLTSLIFGAIMLAIGFLITYLLIVIFCSLSFKFPDSRRLPRLSGSLVFGLASFPLGVYEVILERILMYIFPILFFSAIPFQVMMKGIDYRLIGLSLLFLVMLFKMARIVWDKSIRNYSSASS